MNEEICGKCKHHKPDNPYGGDINEWYCVNEDSDNYTDYTEWKDSCENWEAER